MSVVVFGLIAVAGARIWVVNQVDFSDNRNLIVAAVTLVLGAGDFTVKLGNFTLGGIGTATFGAIILYALLRRGNKARRAGRGAPGPIRPAWLRGATGVSPGRHGPGRPPVPPRSPDPTGS